MSKTDNDWSFSNYVHQHLAIPQLYTPLGWSLVVLDKEAARDLDVHHGIDYVVQDETGKQISLQERFRESRYQRYNDATLRFRRANNKHSDRVESESYKIKADYLVYGICNGSKEVQHKITGFLKWAIIDIRFLQQKYRDGLLIFDNTGSIYCRQQDDKMICPENINPDGSSSFRPFDLKIMNALWGDAPIFKQAGFL